MEKKLLGLLTALYGIEIGPQLYIRVQALIDDRGTSVRDARIESGLTERDSILITYGDQVQMLPEKPLQTLRAFCEGTLSHIVSGIHILPFFPWTSDDGFSVVDYRRVDPSLGDWGDIASMQGDFRLMVDGVINHISAQSTWFQGFLRDDPRYMEYFITVEGSPDLSQVIRPRALPLLTTFITPSGEKKVWTTFSADQIDLNYKNPEVLLEILEILLFYVEHGAAFIRLDAVAYLWKESGTPCIHLPQTHLVIQILRAVLDEAARHVHLITETNVPHRDNLSYFGDGVNEAQLVYNFALPPLILHTFYTGDAGVLSDWAGMLNLPSPKTTFFNFLASHDGIGLNPVRGILSDESIDGLVARAVEHGGRISCKQNTDGSQIPYEININYFDALSNPSSQEPLELQVDRFIASQAIMLSLIGVPGIYFHSLFGSRGWAEGVKLTGWKRTINREKCQLDELQNALADVNSLRSKVFTRYSELLKVRRNFPAFHPHGTQTILDVHPSLFAVERISPDKKSRVLCLHNVSARVITIAGEGVSAVDLLTGQEIQTSKVKLEPYQVMWMAKSAGSRSGSFGLWRDLQVRP